MYIFHILSLRIQLLPISVRCRLRNFLFLMRLCSLVKYLFGSRLGVQIFVIRMSLWQPNHYVQLTHSCVLRCILASTCILREEFSLVSKSQLNFSSDLISGIPRQHI